MISIDINRCEIKIQAEDKAQKINFQISDFDKKLVEVGGWVEYADSHY